VAAWMLEALKSEHELTVLAWEPLDLPELNRFYGTALQPEDFRLLQPLARLRAPLNLAGRLGHDPHPVHRYQLLMRAAKRLAADTDLHVTAFDEADLGGRGIQYVHSPWTQIPLRAVPVTDAGVAARLRPWRLISGFSIDRMRANVTLTNSSWSAHQIERILAVRARVVRPPVPGSFPKRAWEQREDAVAAVARLIPEKRLEMAIEAVRLARRDGADLRLRVIGNARGADPGYPDALRRRIAAEPWLELHEDVSRSALAELLSGCRYGIHPMEREPFGLAVGEMVRAGCIPFTRREGGVAEIAPDERLKFDSAAEAAERLLAVMRSKELRDEIRADLDGRAAALSPERFVAKIRDAVAQFEPRQTQEA
jgi:glycosyltransferase involved in cell wall biosynthesis